MTQELLLEILRNFFCNNQNKKMNSYPQDEEVLNLAFKHDIGIMIGDMMKMNRKNRVINQIVKEKNIQRYIENIKNFHFVAEELEKENIRYVVTKGIYVAKVIYQNEGYRHSGDLDIVINHIDYEKVKKILINNGYVQGIYDVGSKSIKRFSRRQELFYLNFTHQSAPFLKVTKNDLIPVINLDINFSIFWENNCIWKMEKILRDFQMFNYRGYNIRVFQDEIMLLHMCLHAYHDFNSIYVLYKDYSYILKYFADIYGFIQHTSISWKKFRLMCSKYNVKDYVMYIFYYTALIFKDKSILSMAGMEIPNAEFLNRFGLEKEGRFIWKNDFMERVFCEDRKQMLVEHIDQQLLLKIQQGEELEGMYEER